MPAVIVSETGNRLLDDLPAKELRRVIADCEVVDLAVGEKVFEKGCLISHVYFPISACISKVAKVGKHPPIGLLQIGREGMLGATQILGVELAPMRATVQSAGTALRMEVAVFRKTLLKSPSLRAIVGRYLHVLLEQLSQTTACTRFHDVESRLVRWLLLADDRTDANHFHLTHQVLANMLGVQRSAVTIAAGILQQSGLISYSRGDIKILDRAGLEALACECYEILTVDYKRLIA